MSTDLEKRLAAALAARAEQVGPHDLADHALPTPSPHPRRPVVLLAAAACLVVVAAGTAVASLGGDERPAPAPPSDPEVVVPPDVGRDWPSAEEPRAASLDLDGDGTRDRVRFLAEPSEDFEGRTRLETDLSGGGSAYGVVALGTTLYGYDFDPVDVDDDGDEELLLARDGEDGRTTYPFVVELRDGVLVEAPVAATGGAVLQQGPVLGTEEPTADYTLDRVSDFWTDDGALRSALSVQAYPAAGMDWWVPEPYVADAWSWGLGEDDVLRPEPIERHCLSTSAPDRAVCGPGEVDGLPDLAPVADDTVGAGETVELADGLRNTVTVTDEGGLTVLDLDLDGRPARVELPAGARVFRTPASAVFSDGVSLALDQDADGSPDGYVSVVPGAGGPIVDLETQPPPGSADGTSWLTDAGEIFTLTGPDDGAALTQWALGDDGLFSVPRGTVCRTGEALTDVERC